nr:hypothetical protein [Tanacetum cinerariifolium]
MSGTYKGFVCLNQHNIKSFMKLSEVKKFCDGTLIKIYENLVDMVKKNKMGTGNKRLKGRDWTEMDVKKSNEMVENIDKVLKREEQLMRLEEYVRRRPKTVNPRTFSSKKEIGIVQLGVVNQAELKLLLRSSLVFDPSYKLK